MTWYRRFDEGHHRRDREGGHESARPQLQVDHVAVAGRDHVVWSRSHCALLELRA